MCIRDSGITTICTDQNGTSTFCVSMENLILQPNICGCYTDGILFITPNPTTISSTTGCKHITMNRVGYDFGYDDQGMNLNECDEYYSTNSGNTVMSSPSCQ